MTLVVKKDGSLLPDLVSDFFNSDLLSLNGNREFLAVPSANLTETEKEYKIELAAPGLQREDLFVRITDNGYLSISALHKEPDRVEQETYQKHTFNYECFNRELLLPDNIDTDFIKAEYRKGILSFWFLKTEKRYEMHDLPRGPHHDHRRPDENL